VPKVRLKLMPVCLLRDSASVLLLKDVLPLSASGHIPPGPAHFHRIRRKAADDGAIPAGRCGCATSPSHALTPRPRQNSFRGRLFVFLQLFDIPQVSGSECVTRSEPRGKFLRLQTNPSNQTNHQPRRVPSGTMAPPRGSVRARVARFVATRLEPPSAVCLPHVARAVLPRAGVPTFPTGETNGCRRPP
jgi:hypothetical protein